MTKLQKDPETERQANSTVKTAHTNVRANRQTDRQTDRQTGRQTDRQRDRERQSETERQRENLNSKTLFSKDCSLGSSRERERGRDRETDRDVISLRLLHVSFSVCLVEKCNGNPD